MQYSKARIYSSTARSAMKLLLSLSKGLSYSLIPSLRTPPFRREERVDVPYSLGRPSVAVMHPVSPGENRRH